MREKVIELQEEVEEKQKEIATKDLAIIELTQALDVLNKIIFLQRLLGGTFTEQIME